jgi:predicted ribosome-associated RNA-binding protein Tma20
VSIFYGDIDIDNFRSKSPVDIELTKDNFKTIVEAIHFHLGDYYYTEKYMLVFSIDDNHFEIFFDNNKILFKKTNKSFSEVSCLKGHKSYNEVFNRIFGIEYDFE